MILKAKTFLYYRVSAIAYVTGAKRDGTPTARFDVVERRKDEIFCAPPSIAQTLLAEGSAAEVRVEGPLLALAEATLATETPSAAALAGLSVRGIRTWHAIMGSDGHWRSAAMSMGRVRGSFGATFRSAAEIEAHWTSYPDAVPLFSFLTEYGFWRAYVWRACALREIATSVHTIARS